MGEHYMTLGEAERYLKERYGLRWSRPHWRKLIRSGRLRGAQPMGPGGWWYVSRESIDELIEGQRT